MGRLTPGEVPKVNPKILCSSPGCIQEPGMQMKEDTSELIAGEMHRSWVFAMSTLMPISTALEETDSKKSSLCWACTSMDCFWLLGVWPLS